MKTSTALIPSLLAVVVAASCGGDDGGSASSTPAPGPSVTFSVPPETSTPETVPPESVPPESSTPETSTPEPGATAPAEPVAPFLSEAIVVLEEPVDLAARPGDDTLFLVERPGRVRAVRDGQLDPTPLLDIQDLTQNRGEQGLLGLTFSLDGATAYVNYTDLDGATVIAGYPVGDDGVFDATGRFSVLTIDQPFSNHNGGAVVVGPDGFLYIPTGDGGAADDRRRAALNVSSLLGKILRIQPDPDGGYSIPDDNPFVDVDGARPEIWSVGLRNPWRVSFDRDTGDLWIADVGQNMWEEISVAWADEGLGRGASFGWSAYEGTHRFNEDQPADGHVLPVFEYPHGDAGCSISGGVRYRGTKLTGLQGSYVFGDFCSGRVWILPVADDRTAGEAVEIGQVSDVAAVAQGPDGELYVLALSGEVYALVA